MGSLVKASNVSEPLLVYNRIDVNRRRTRQLLGLFAAVSLPFATGATVWLLPLVASVGMFVVLLVPGLITTLQDATLQQAIVAEATLFGSSLFLAAMALTAVTTTLIYRYSSVLVLRSAGARAVSREDELDLHRSVENLCIGAGLPKPQLCLIESDTPNAFALGRDPQQATLVVTRGLLTLLERSELEGVIAHELSHIGNQDVRLNTTVAGVVGTLTLPVSIVTRVVTTVVGWNPAFAVVLALIVMPVVSSFLMIGGMLLREGPGFFSAPGNDLLAHRSGALWLVWLWSLHALGTPLYMMFVAPLLARLLRRGVSREREFLADADAVALTRNPDALALALVKVGAAHGAPITAGPATTHLYFVDPLHTGGTWLARWFRSHPPIEDRLDLLVRMGSGIATSSIHDAIRASRAPRGGEGVDVVPHASADVRRHGESDRPDQARSDATDERRQTLADLEGEPTILAEEASHGRLFRLADDSAELYSKPDGWSPVIASMSRGAVVMFKELDRGFARIQTDSGLVGYVGRRTRLVPMVDGA